MALFTKEIGLLEKLRKSSHTFAHLPETICIPVSKQNSAIENKPLLLASVDDIAFAQQGLSTELSTLLAQMDALRRLHDDARKLGAKGVDCALEILREHGEIQ